jgi:anti-sigma B factor antagonist
LRGPSQFETLPRISDLRPPFQIVESPQPAGPTRVSLRGELDVSWVDEVRLRVEALSDGGAEIRLDLSELEFIDSTGISLLITLVKHARQTGGALKVDPVPPGQVRRVLELTGADRFLWPPPGV